MAENGRANRDAGLLAALAAGATVRQAAAQARVSERTAHRRLANPDFRRRVAEVRAQMMGRALGKMADSMAAAADTLRSLLAAKSDSIRLGACWAVLELTPKLREFIDHEERLQALEKQVAGKGGTEWES
jgi:hypothetical protein